MVMANVSYAYAQADKYNSPLVAQWSLHLISQHRLQNLVLQLFWDTECKVTSIILLLLFRLLVLVLVLSD